MKKYVFQFESVLKIRRHKRSLCRQLLGEILQTDQRLMEQKQNLERSRKEQFQEIRLRQAKGVVDIDGATSLRFYAGQLQAQIQTVTANRKLVEKQIVLCKQTLARAEQDVKAMEKLSDKYRDQFHYEQNRKESLQLEETWSATQQTGVAR
ncbi:MAG: flagellar FliJ family protein [Planctomycetes bacterium]|nr:flagellar FliJ family protein [Planctomycetota bacterium]MCH9727222.1 flagellar FliJ family protein [Planctomycetota bacterium]MCH9776717.1 flagellar FliJ family protein [Planctomycetota bacterium]MDF1742930.1 flagellar FliJ family protein [Gimesia sp.]